MESLAVSVSWEQIPREASPGATDADVVVAGVDDRRDRMRT
jgi:hypothetical protein